MFKISFLKNQHWVDCALPCLARKHNITTQQGWAILQANLKLISIKIFTMDASVHIQVKRWYNLNRNKLPALGLNQFKKKRPKATGLNYNQLICIVFLDLLFSNENFRQARQTYTPTVKKVSWWQTWYQWFLNILFRKKYTKT